ncbi:uncharacterized protein JCM6883_004995 [Sporobolomyces salmoneus]|uniref:uncharacterized protein n=1 Tax=Sporobolomyces salmoneus TaxID=183962 RepID=UPI0031748D1E
MATAEQKSNLNVRDALSYLDRVKVTFAEQTEVYDRFLTIMKEFKSQGIDTPGVIDRVSTLFRGHPALIQGFNTFLPPGYRIECTIDQSAGAGAGSGGEKGVTTITVTTPMGMTTRTQVTDPSLEQSNASTSSNVKQESTSQAPVHSLPPPANTSNAAVGSSATPSVLSNQPATTQAPPSAPPTPSAATTPAPADSRPPMEFNHAINYVNKIKNRFLKEPDTYKSFLEILQTYQKEGKAIQEVYAQVTELFRGAPDLLDEFKQFLPDTSASAQQQAQPLVPSTQSQAAAQAQAQQSTSSGGGRGTTKRAAPGAGGKDGAKRAKAATKPSGEKSTGGVGKGKRKAEAPLRDLSQSGRGVKGQSPADLNSMYHSDSPSLGAGGGDGYSSAAAVQHAQAQAYYGGVAPHHHPSAQPSAAAAYGQTQPYGYDTPIAAPPPQPLLAPKPIASAPDLAFFQRVKVHTKDQAVYFEFLKLVNLYTQELIDLTALVARAWLFLHQDERLWQEFRELVGWSEGDAVGDPGHRIEVVDGKRIVENVPRMDGEGWRKSRLDAGKDWKTYGPSYRKLPKEEISLSCSGRDALCWEVLNDEWVSQPSFASDEGFVANRKNPYEEALHRSEEERHEYDYHIEANLRTITLLEPIASRIAVMDPEERAVFRLKPGLGNQNKSIYQRVLKRIYGKEQGLEVIQALHENPCVAVPIVLARLKQKDEEWKRALREWNRVWRESDAKNFWKALDHQGISLKANDKRFLNAKALVSEIESLKREQNQRATISARPEPTPRFQLAYDVSDRRAFYDAARLVFSYLDRSHLVTFAEKPRVDAALREILSLTFAISTEEFSAELLAGTNEGEDVESNLDSASEAGGVLGQQSLDEAVEAALLSTGASRKNKKSGDLRKKALRKAITTEKRTRGRPAVNGGGAVSAPTSRDNSPAPSVAGGDTDSVMNDGTPGPDGYEAGGEAMSREGSVDTSVAGGDSVQGSPLVDSGTFATPVEPKSNGEIIRPIEDKPSSLAERKAWNMFSNSTLYAFIRFFQVLYHRLTLLRNSAVSLALPPPPQPITVSHVPSLSLSLSLAPANGERWTASAEYYYQRALSLCEKFFEGELDQPAFEDSIRRILASQGYMLFTIDKLVTGMIKQVQAALVDPKTKELLSLLRQDRAHPERSTHSQQLAYRQHAESALGSDENLYRLEWIPATKTLSFQLVGKDTVGPEDIPAMEREWAKYVEAYIHQERTPGLPSDPVAPFLSRNIRVSRPKDGSLPKGLTAISALQSKICMRSYKLFFAAETEDVLIRHRKGAPFTPVEVRDNRIVRCSEWMDKRSDELGLLAGANEKKEDAAPAKVEEVKVDQQAKEVEAPKDTAKEPEKESTAVEDVEMKE